MQLSCGFLRTCQAQAAQGPLSPATYSLLALLDFVAEALDDLQFNHDLLQKLLAFWQKCSSCNLDLN